MQTLPQHWCKPSTTCIRSFPILRCIHFRNYSHHTAADTQLPAPVDLLQVYRGLVALGKIKFDGEQIRVVMQLKRLHNELADYAPPALTSRYLTPTSTIQQDTASQPWWKQDPGELQPPADLRALVRVKTHAEDLASLTTPKGVLITGPPGSGKSFLVDLWYNALPTPYKARKHYNELVLEIYRGVWEETQLRMASLHRNGENLTLEPQPWNRAIRDKWRELVVSDKLPIKWLRQLPTKAHPTYTSQQTIAFTVAKRLILRHWLLVFDEIQLLDVSSATLLADVLSWFWRMGGIIVGTSNKVPDDLYKNGVQRERLEPFVEAMKVRCPVISMRSTHDWREVRAGDGTERTWYLFGQSSDFERKLWQLSEGVQAPASKTLAVFGRTLPVPWASNGVCKFSFSELCEQSLGPADYITIASTFHTVAITSVPILKLSEKNQARRFISLIDALYEARCKVICLAQTEPGSLFFPDARSPDDDRRGLSESGVDMDVMMAEAVAETQDVYRPNVSSYDAPNMAEAHPSSPSLALERLSLFSGKDEQFAFKRALSRLLEMTSASYGREERWTPLPTGMRQWETSHLSSSSQLYAPHHDHRSVGQAADSESDYAAEAAYLEQSATPGVPAAADFADRPGAPRLREEHIWGVREDEWARRRGRSRVEAGEEGRPRSKPRS